MLDKVVTLRPASRSIYHDDYVLLNKYSGRGGFFPAMGFSSQPLKKVESKNFSFYSLYSQHCQAAAANHTYKGGKVAEMQGPTPHCAAGTNPRASIVGAPNTNTWFCLEFSGRDICTLVWVTGIDSNTDCNNNSLCIYLVSMYLDIMSLMEGIFPLGWKELVMHCNSSNFPLKACVDTNAHSILWGEETNPHREVIENFIFSHSLVIENVGCVPIFSARGTDTCIDVMLSLNLPSPLEGWRVNDEATLSDHNHIDFSLGLGPHSYPEAAPNLAKANWDKFQEILGNKSFRDPRYVTKRWLNAATLRFENSLKQTLHRVCPLCRGPHKVNRPYYWEGEVEELRKLARRA